MDTVWFLEVGDGIGEPLPAFIGDKDKAIELARKWVEMLGVEHRESIDNHYGHWDGLCSYALAVMYTMDVNATDNFDELFGDKVRFMEHLRNKQR